MRAEQRTERAKAQQDVFELRSKLEKAVAAKDELQIQSDLEASKGFAAPCNQRSHR